MYSVTQGDYTFVNTVENGAISRYWNIAHVYEESLSLDILAKIRGTENYTLVLDSKVAEELGISQQETRGEPGRCGVIFVGDGWTAIAYSQAIYKAYAKRYTVQDSERDPSAYSDSCVIVLDPAARMMVGRDRVLPTRSYSTGYSRLVGVLPSLGVIPMTDGTIASYPGSLLGKSFDADYLMYKGSKLIAAYNIHRSCNFCCPCPVSWADDEYGFIGRLLARGETVSKAELPEDSGFYFDEAARSALATWIEKTRNHQWFDGLKFMKLAEKPASRGWSVEAEVRSAILPADMTQDAWSQVRGMLVSESNLIALLASTDLKGLVGINSGMGADLILIDDDFAAILAEFNAKYSYYKVQIFQATLDQLDQVATEVAETLCHSVATKFHQAVHSNDSYLSEVAEVISKESRAGKSSHAQVINLNPETFGTSTNPKNPFKLFRQNIPALNIAKCSTATDMKAELLDKLPYYLDPSKKDMLLSDQYVFKSNPSCKSGLLFEPSYDPLEYPIHLFDDAGQRIYIKDADSDILFDSWDGLTTLKGEVSLVDGYLNVSFEDGSEIKGSDHITWTDAAGVADTWYASKPLVSTDYEGFALKVINEHLVDDLSSQVTTAMAEAVHACLSVAREAIKGAGASLIAQYRHDVIDDQDWGCRCCHLHKKHHSSFRGTTSNAACLEYVELRATSTGKLVMDLSFKLDYIGDFRPYDVDEGDVARFNKNALAAGFNMSSKLFKYTTSTGITKAVEVVDISNEGTSAPAYRWYDDIIDNRGAKAKLVNYLVAPGLGAIVSRGWKATFGRHDWSSAPSSYARVTLTSVDLDTDITNSTNDALSTQAVAWGVGDSRDRVINTIINGLTSSAAELAFRAVRPLLSSIQAQGASESMVCYLDGNYTDEATLLSIATVDLPYAETIKKMIDKLVESLQNDPSVVDTVNRFDKFRQSISQLIAKAANAKPIYWLNADAKPRGYRTDARALDVNLSCLRR